MISEHDEIPEIIHFGFLHIPLHPVLTCESTSFMEDYSIELPLINNQAIIEVQIKDMRNDYSQRINALIDTGAYYSWVNDNVFKKTPLLKLVRSSNIDRIGNGLIKAEIYEADIKFPRAKETEPFLFCYGKDVLKLNGLDMVIGTDLLKRFEFSYNLPKGTFKLKYIG